MKLRKIRTKTLLLQGLCYRSFVIVVETVALWAYTGQFALSIGASFGLNIIRMCGYYMFHYVFARFFKMGAKHG
jgi:hypothetical protein